MYKQSKPNSHELQPMKYLPMLSQSNQELAIRRMHERSWLQTNEHLIQYIDFKETFNLLISIYSENNQNFDLSFTYVSSGLAIIKKKTDDELISNKKTFERTFTFKNILRKLWIKIKKN